MTVSSKGLKLDQTHERSHFWNLESWSSGSTRVPSAHHPRSSLAAQFGAHICPSPTQQLQGSELVDLGLLSPGFQMCE